MKLMGELLYHYTSIETLQKILQDYDNKEICMWATHVAFLNDPKEYIYALELIKESVIKYEIQNNVSENKRKSRCLFSDEGGGFISSLVKIAGEPYLISFSENEDSLSMWRGYAKNGLGISIGFDKRMLTEYAQLRSNEINHTVVLECTYDKAKTIESMVGSWTNYYEDFSLGTEGNPGITLISLEPLETLMNLCFSSKNASYKEEQEYRLCTYEHSDYNIRVSGSIMVPYVQHVMPKKMIKKIIVGPCLDQHIAKKGLEMFLKKHDCSDVVVDVSNTSYRQIQ